MSWPAQLSWILTAACTFLPAAFAQSSSADPQLSELPPAIRAIVEGFHGQLYFAGKNLTTGRALAYRAGTKVQTASVIKVPIMIEAFAQAREGRINLRSRIRFDESNRVPGAGILQDLSDGLEITVLDAITLMIVLSDNSATNMVIDLVGIDSVNRRLRDLGFRETWLNKKVFRPAPPDLPEERARYGLGVTTASEMMGLMERLRKGALGDAESTRTMLEILGKQRDLEQIPRNLAGPRWVGYKVANKTGALDRVRNDVGLVSSPDGDFVLSLFAQDSEDQRWTPDNEAAVALAHLAQALLEELR